MKLNELFDPKEIVSPTVKANSYEVEQDVGGRKILFIAMNSHEDENEWRIDFAEHLDVDVDEPFVSVKTGKGKEFEVFSFVVACAKDFVKRKNPRVIKLRSVVDEPSRAKLYARLARKFGSDYDITHEKTARHDVTVMTKKALN